LAEADSRRGYMYKKLYKYRIRSEKKEEGN